MLIVGKPGMQDTTVSFYVLDTARDFLGIDNRVFIPQDLCETCIPISKFHYIDRED